jgi:hypothetical protein
VDERLRRLEREAALGDLDATRRLFIERVKLGDLGRERVLLACYLGHPVAWEMLAEEDDDPPQAPEDALEWVRALEPFGRTACARAALTAARRAADPAGDDRVSLGVRAATDALATWLECPCASHEGAVKAALESALDLLFRKPRYSLSAEVFNSGRSGVAAAAVALHPSTLLNPHYQQLIAQSLGLRHYTYSLGTLAGAAFYWNLAIVGPESREGLRELIRAELLEWVLD